MFVPLVLRIFLASVADVAGFMSPTQVCLLPFLNSTLPVMCSNHENITLLWYRKPYPDSMFCVQSNHLWSICPATAVTVPNSNVCLIWTAKREHFAAAAAYASYLGSLVFPDAPPITLGLWIRQCRWGLNAAKRFFPQIRLCRHSARLMTACTNST